VADAIDVAFLSLRVVFGPAFTVAFRLKTSGRENVPRTGAAILVANHASFLDPILIGICARRPVRFLVANDFYRDPRLHLALRWLGAIPVGGDAGSIRSFRRIGDVIKNGSLLGIFPEGGITRDGAMKPFRAGAAVLALRTGVPLVPIYLDGTFAALPRYAKWPRFVPVTVRIGNPIPVTARRNPSSDEIAELSESLRSAVAALAVKARRL
jgi:1-acyl-sn-glycerol-3-phosphate acyltransferase